VAIEPIFFSNTPSSPPPCPNLGEGNPLASNHSMKRFEREDSSPSQERWICDCARNGRWEGAGIGNYGISASRHPANPSKSVRADQCVCPPSYRPKREIRSSLTLLATTNLRDTQAPKDTINQDNFSAKCSPTLSSMGTLRPLIRHRLTMVCK
jgi:hypothetical protein